MNLINELRMLAEDLYVNGYNRYSAAMSKAADELGSLERYRTAYNEWVDKTEWVQADTSLPAKYLGMHRADVLKVMISELEERCDELSADKGTWYRMSKVFSKRITEVEEALKASEERCDVLTAALRLIAETDPIDAALDPQRAVRVAKRALEENEMSDTKEMRQLAQAALIGPDGVSMRWLKLLKDFQEEANPSEVLKILDHLEAAEKERDWHAERCEDAMNECEALRAKIEGVEDERMIDERRIADLMADLNRVGHENDALRAKIAEMERQEPVGVLHVGSYYGEELQDWEFEADQRVCDRLNERHVTNPTSLKLYALPGAKGEAK